MEEHLEYTRADDQRITEMYALMPIMDKKIDDMVQSMRVCQSNCTGSKSGFNRRLTKVEKIIENNNFVRSWKDAVFSKSTAVVIFIIAVVDFTFKFILWEK
jgi:hypothetical protein